MKTAVAATLAFCLPAGAQVIDPALVPDTLTVSPRIEAVLAASTYSDPFTFVISRAQSAFGPQNGVTIDSLDLRLQQALAGERAQWVRDIMTYDLDWDGRVTRAEFSSLRPDLTQAQLDQIVETVDQTWPIDGEELRVFVGRNVLESEADFVADMVDWDMNGDGLIAVEEMEAILRAHVAAQPAAPCDPDADPLLPPTGDLPACEDL